MMCTLFLFQIAPDVSPFRREPKTTPGKLKRLFAVLGKKLLIDGHPWQLVAVGGDELQLCHMHAPSAKIRLWPQLSYASEANRHLVPTTTWRRPVRQQWPCPLHTRRRL